MRGTRWLLMAAILAILGAVVATYRLQKRFLQEQAPAKPGQLPLALSSAMEGWEFVRMDGSRMVAKIAAQRVTQEKDKSKTELQHVRLSLFHKDGQTFDVITSAHGEFFPSEERLYSDGEVEITLGLPVEGQPQRTLVSIRSAGVTFDSVTGRAVTDRAAEFRFQNGTGKCVGASYDPSTRELHMKSQVELNWKALGPRSKPMKLESGGLVYREGGSTVSLSPWARLTRENTLVEAADTVVTLKEGVIQLIEAKHAHGADRYPGRELQYAADHLRVEFSDTGVTRKIIGENNARLVSLSDASQTTVTSDRVDLDFADLNGESALTKALATGNAVVESKPLPASGRPLPETRLLRSRTIETIMRPGGREIEEVRTHEPGELEFLPNRAGQRHRKLEGERMWIAYGPRNRIHSFRTVKARTQTDPTPEERARNRAPAKTASDDLQAEFDPKTGQMARMEQWRNFSYQEGDRHATAARAVLESAQNLITLETNARTWDAAGSTSADRIRIDQQTGNFHAAGHVNSSRAPDKKKSGSEMLSGDEPVQAVAQTMDSFNGNRLVHYEGSVVLWQGADRVQADRVDIDREQRRLTASGSVMTQFLEQAQPKGRGSQKRVFTTVRAANLVYTEDDRLARYTGGIVLARPDLNVKASELRAFLAPQGASSRLEKAYGDGNVHIVRTSPDRTLTGTAEHSEYYTGEEKIILRGGEPQLADSRRGIARGAELTYFANDDRLLVNGAPERPAVSRIRRK